MITVKIKFITILMAFCLLFTTFFVGEVSAENKEFVFDDWKLWNVSFAGSSAYPEDYNNEGVVNLRCNYSSWDSKKEYMWLISDWSTTKEPGSLYLGDGYDFSKITAITFDYVTNGSGSLKNNYVSLAADPNGEKIIASYKISQHTGALKSPQQGTMEIKDNTYTGPVYIYIQYTSRAFVGNLKFSLSEDINIIVPTATPRPIFTMRPVITPTVDPARTQIPDTIVFKDNTPPVGWLIAGYAVTACLGMIAIIFIWKKRRNTSQ